MKRLIFLLSAFFLIHTSYTAEMIPSQEDDTWHECTSWFVFHDITEKGVNLLHKNRDAKARPILPIIHSTPSQRRWIALGQSTRPGDAKKPAGPRSIVPNDSIAISMGVNASGVALCCNMGEMTTEPSTPRAKIKGTPYETTKIIQTCLSECDTAAQSLEKIREIVRSGQYFHGSHEKASGSIFLVMDTQEGYLVELSAKRVSALRYTKGYGYRANAWHNPGMAEASKDTIGHTLHSISREFIVRRDLNAALQNHPKISISDMIFLARDTQAPDPKSHPTATVCNTNTNSAGTMEIDRDFPDVLTTGYFFIGPPRHTLCLPFPICAETLPPAIANCQWADAAWARFDKNGYKADIPAAWLEFEVQTLSRYANAQKQAKEKLTQGKRQEAIQLLNQTAADIWDKAIQLLLPESVK